MANQLKSRRYLWRTLRTSLAVAAMSIAAYELVGGGHGLLAKQTYEQRIAALQLRLSGLEAEKSVWERRVGALGTDTVDLDMLREQAQRMLFFSDPGDILLPAAPRGNSD